MVFKTHNCQKQKQGTPGLKSCHFLSSGVPLKAAQMESDIGRIWEYFYNKVRSGKANETAAIHVRQKKNNLLAIIKEET